MQTEITRLQDPFTGDICWKIRHSSGLALRVMEMPEFRTACAQFGTRFGSVYRRIRRPDGSAVEIPAGTAHYMEHKLFDKAEGDAAVMFDAFGAASNAFTDFDRTVYHFHTQQDFSEALSLLLRFVQTPYFTAETVSRERPIITQEIMEARDDPADAVFDQLLGGMYRDLALHPHILGTPESIAEITPELLHLCHRVFYHPQNMVLSCAGNVRVSEIIEIADRLMQPLPPPAERTEFPAEPEAPAQRVCSRKMSVGKQQFMLGFKSPPLCGTARLRESLLCSLTLDLLAGSASPLFQRLLHEGLVNDTFDTDCFAGDGWFAVLAEGESDKPEAVQEALCAEIAHVQREGADEALFGVLKKAAYGDSIIGMNDPESACTAMTDAFMWGCDSPFARTQLLAELSPADIPRCLQTRFRPDRITRSVIIPE